ncbi:hypothetical protein PIB30_023636 [Stylosanthes scabra]|uniref:Uncharacterized protein n=1 Tax=Stylosanthes scabra TaxID=79078 RepID=A0ABU6QA43_9FABA|nr:hypothetical protein [Stylosanthes scabra]
MPLHVWPHVEDLIRKHLNRHQHRPFTKANLNTTKQRTGLPLVTPPMTKFTSSSKAGGDSLTNLLKALMATDTILIIIKYQQSMQGMPLLGTGTENLKPHISTIHHHIVHPNVNVSLNAFDETFVQKGWWRRNGARRYGLSYAQRSVADVEDLVDLFERRGVPPVKKNFASRMKGRKSGSGNLKRKSKRGGTNLDFRSLT